MKVQYVLALLWLLILIIVSTVTTEVKFATDLQRFTLLNEIAMSCKISVFSCAWVFVLSQPEMIFGFVRTWLFEMRDNYSFTKTGVDLEKRAEAEYFLKPILTCELCTAGNFGFWAYFINCEGYFVYLDAFFVVSSSILFTKIQRKLWKKT